MAGMVVLVVVVFFVVVTLVVVVVVVVVVMNMTVVCSQKQNLLSLAQNSSGAIRRSCNTRFRRRFRKIPEGSGADG